jgi:hypothetical protein
MCNEALGKCDVFIGMSVMLYIKKGFVLVSDNVHHQMGDVREMKKLICHFFFF